MSKKQNKKKKIVKKSEKFIKEFRDFALRGNVIDLAVGIIIGGAFQIIIKSLINDIIMPIVAFFTGSADYTKMKVAIGKTYITYGNFISAVINFIIMAFVIFLIVRFINRLRNVATSGKKKKNTPTTKICPYCFGEININATRCMFCTSEQTEETQIEN